MKGARPNKRKKGVETTMMRNTDKFLTRIKASLMIPASDTFADEEISLHIASCEDLLSSMGVSTSVVGSDNPLVEGLIMIYVKTYYGFKSDGSVRELPANFGLMARQLALTKGDE